MRILYRLRQFWRTVFLKIDIDELEQVQACLSPGQRRLFLQLQPGEQDHAVSIFRKLQQQGEPHPDLLVAALLHDVGKLRYRLNPWERAGVVLVRVVSPGLAQRWGNLPQAGWDSLPGWRKAFVVAKQHAEWGAGMAQELGVSPLTQTLIRLHHQPYSPYINDMEKALLQKLRSADNEN